MTFPTNVGYPFENENDKYLLLEMHYDNPLELDNIVDDSGMRLYFTKELRVNDLGLMILG